MDSMTQARRIHRMPYGFGPTSGPRQDPRGQAFDWSASRRRSVLVSYLTSAEALAQLLPPGFRLAGEPVVTIEIAYYTNLPWLAGRGYNVLGVRFPAAFKAKDWDYSGSFLSVLWENLADPIISGREELGFAKIFCDIPEPRKVDGRELYSASWLGHRFLDIELSGLKEAPSRMPPVSGLSGENDGVLHYKYIPATGRWGEADVAYACLTPSAPSGTIEGAWRANGTVKFTESTWEQLPTMFHIVNRLAQLPMLENREAWVVSAVGGRDLSDQRRLEPI